MIPWGLTPARVSILAAVVLTACAASSGVTWFGAAVPRIETANQRTEAAKQTARADDATLRARYQEGRADGEKAAREAQDALNQQAQEANDARLEEYGKIAARAERSAGLSLSVCSQARTAAAAGAATGSGSAGPTAGDPPAAGVLAGSDGADPGAVLRAQLVDYAADAEGQSADLRALDASCRVKPR